MNTPTKTRMAVVEVIDWEATVADAFSAPHPSVTASTDDENIPGWHTPKKDQGFVVLDGDIIVILMKFTVKNFEDIPQGVRLRKTGSRDHLHAKDAIEMDLAHLAELGRVRNNRVDTGEMVLHVPSAQESIASLRAGGYQVEDLCYYQHEKKDARTGKTSIQFVIQVVFSRNLKKGEGATFQHGISEAEADAIRALEAKAWEFWGWDNRLAGKPITLNFTGGHAPRVCKNPASSTKKLRIKDGVMRAYDE